MFAAMVHELESLQVEELPRSEAEAALATSSRVRRWLDGLDVRLAARVGACAQRDPASKPAEESIAAATRRSSQAARRDVRRAKAAAKVPALGPALGSGGVSGEHLDVVGQALARLPGDRRQRFSAEYGQRIADEAERSSPEDLRVAVERWVREFDASDGIDRLATQRRQVGMRVWTDRASGMWRFSGQLDPVTGVVVAGRLHATVDALFRERVPEGCPDDPEAKQSFLRAHALVALTGEPVRGAAPPEGPAPVSGSTDEAAGQRAASATCSCGRDGGGSAAVRWRTEAVVVIDARTLSDGWHARSHVDLGATGLELPLDAVRRMVHSSRVVPVWRSSDGLVERVGDGRSALDRGRESRLASRAQRCALRVMHPTCAVAGCSVHFDHCQPHHIVWWERGGGTDLHNLVPLCSRHHHLVHDAGWQLHLARDRTLTVTLPDGTTLVSRLVRRWPP